MSTNAKIELLDHLEYHGKSAADVAKAVVYYEGYTYLDHVDEEDLPLVKVVVLNENHSESEYAEFLDRLDFEYSSDYGCQEIMAHVWYTDGSWSERKEDGGSEWWSYVKRPDFEMYLNRINRFVSYTPRD